MKLLYIFICLFSGGLYATLPTLTCTHPQICHILERITGAPVKKSIPGAGDHHHHELTAREIKPIYSADFLVTAPLQLQPWLRKIMPKRKKKKTLTPLISRHFLKIYHTTNIHALAHFWLYPDIFCAVYGEIVTTLQSWGSKVQQGVCDPALFADWNKALLKKYTFILTHDALAPQLIAKGAKVFSLRDSHQHLSLAPQVLKNLKDFLQTSHGEVVWVFEQGINIPSLLKDWVKPQHQVLSLDVMASPFAGKTNPLTKIVHFLRPAK